MFMQDSNPERYVVYGLMFAAVGVLYALAAFVQFAFKRWREHADADE